ncbi:MAG: hypothetical protein ACOC5T_07290, partial [Elusimicrobiota bacterium]
PWTYNVYPKIKEALETDLEDIEDKGKHRVVREIQEWFEKGDRKEKFYDKTEKIGNYTCNNCGRFFSPKRSVSKKMCNDCYAKEGKI